MKIDITKVAQQHFSKLLAEEMPDTGIRVSVNNPLTPKAEVGITFCPKGESLATDIKIQCDNFILYIDANSKDALEDASIDYKETETSSQLIIKAPNIKGKEPGDEDIKAKIQYFIDSEINPALAQHRGVVYAEEVIEQENGLILKLKFGGGCQGCSMVDKTLKHGIEKSLKEKFPNIIDIVDDTSHADGQNPYFKV